MGSSRKRLLERPSPICGDEGISRGGKMKEKIIEILNKNSERLFWMEYGDKVEVEAVQSSEYETVADEILELINKEKKS